MTGTINYKPGGITDAAGMWTPTVLDPVAWRRDMLAARALGFGTLRVFLNVLPSTADDSAGGFNLPAPLPSQLARLTQFCAAAKQQGMTLQMCLFDSWGSFGYVGQTKQWAQAVAGAVDPSVIAAVELKNEVQFASTTPYTGGVGVGDPTLASTVTVGQAATAWATALIPHLRTVFPGVPVVASCNGVPSSNLAAGIAGGLIPDRWEWHCYSAPAAVLNDLRWARTVAGPSLVIGETGMASNNVGEQAAADYLALVRACCQAVGLPAPNPWCLLDMAGLSDPKQGSFGLVGADYRLKAAARLYA